MTIEDLLKVRLKAIQAKHNFNPNLGATQVRTAPPKIRETYAAFRELVCIAKASGLEIPYSPSGAQEDTRHEVVSKSEFVYLLHRKGTNECKIGYSTDLTKRLSALNTGNGGSLAIVAQAPGGRDLEQAIHRHLEPLKIPGRHKEWFYLDDSLRKEVARKMCEGIEAFTGTLEPPRTSSPSPGKSFGEG